MIEHEKEEEKLNRIQFRYTSVLFNFTATTIILLLLLLLFIKIRC
jgi:hypothetical protein